MAKPLSQPKPSHIAKGAASPAQGTLPLPFDTPAPDAPLNLSPYALLHAATHAVREDNAAEPVTPTTPACGYCQRGWEEVEEPGQAFAYRYAPSAAVELLCSTCYTPRISAPHALGIESYRGKSRAPSPGKLGMLPGCGGIVTHDATLHLALPRGFVEKYADGHYGQRGQIHEIGPGVRPLDILLALIQGGQIEAERGFLYIDLWGRKPDALMQGLCLTHSLAELWCNTEKGPFPRDLLAHAATARELCRQGIAGLGLKPGFWMPIRQAAQGEPLEALSDDMAAWVSKVPEPQALLAALPINPHDRLELPAMMRSLIPRISEDPVFLEEAR
jgi:hypothetical protein